MTDFPNRPKLLNLLQKAAKRKKQKEAKKRALEQAKLDEAKKAKTIDSAEVSATTNDNNQNSESE